jgi:imidazolonepropionase-like amidohydrolase
VTHHYGHFYWCNGEADGLESIRAVVRQLVAEGADHIKIMASGGATAGNIPYYASYTAEELRVAVKTAHGLGRLTTAHCRAKQSMINALEAGLDCIEHAEFLVPGDVVEYGAEVSSSGIMQYDPRVTERILTQGTFVSFTFQAGGYDTLVELRTKRDHERLSPAEERRRDALERYYKMKLGISGSLLADGMHPRLVIMHDTSECEPDRGRLAEGRAADIVVFDPTGIADLATLTDPYQGSAGIAHVFVNGVEVVTRGVASDARPGRVLRRA